MTYQGYMALANDEGETLELVNAARVKAYTDNLAPSIGLRGCDDCEGLDNALGETYTNPTDDNAPWYDPTDPATAGFYGVYPLAFEGIDDSTRSIESAELTGDGSVVVGSRFTGKDIRVTGVAFAADEASLYAGVSWLDNALNGTEEGRCFGDRLNLYSSCPPVETFPAGFATPYTLVNPPSAAELAAWTTTSGTITGDANGVNFLWDNTDPDKVACREITGLITGEQYQLRLRLEAFGDYFVSLGPDCVVRDENLIPDPRMTATTLSLEGATVADSRPSSGSPDGGSYFSRLVTVANTTSPMTMDMSGTGLSAIPVVEGRFYTISWYARKTAGGPTTRATYTWYDAGGVAIGATVTGTSQAVGTAWTRFSEATVVAPAGAAFMHVSLQWVGTALVNQTLDFAQAQLNQGSTATTYFDGDYPNSHWTGTENASSSEFEENVDYETIFGWGTDHAPPTEPTVLDFIARSTSMFLSIQPTDSNPATPTLDLQVQAASVRRVSRPGVVDFGTGDDAVAPSDGWTHLAPSGMAVSWDLRDTAVYTDAQNPFGGSTSYTASHGVERTLFGLQVGSRYRLMVEFDTSWNETDVSATLSLDPIIAISNSAGYLQTYADDNPGTFQYFRVIEFTATATSAVLFFHPTSTLAVGSFGTVRWLFHEYMVEEILTTDETEPQAGRFQERTMYEVKASQGPILTNVRTSPCGVMGQITYSLRAGNPFKYRSPVFAGGLPAGTSETVVDIPCSDDGLPQIVNFMYNPSVETNATGYTTTGAGSSGARTASATAIVGGFVYRGTAPNTPGNILQSATATYDTSLVTSGPIPLEGDELTVSIYFRATNALWTGTYTYILDVTMTGFPVIQYTGSVSVPTADVWHRVVETFVLPDNLPLETIAFQIVTPVAITQGGGMDLDGFMIQRGSSATQVFDETDPEAEWSGTANSSAVLLNQTLTDISEDPDCPTPPAPPGPPEITNACVAQPTTYTRTVVSIPDDTVPRNLTAYPVITLVAGSSDVRQARIRFWENPSNLTIDQLDPCSYDGEIIVSYLAAGATMVIDGVLREATVSLPGFPEQNANHVLYGPDGGPVDWPELSGGIPYLVTLELDSAQPYTDTLMTIDLVVRD